jgi:hypothetical protein
MLDIVTVEHSFILNEISIHRKDNCFSGKEKEPPTTTTHIAGHRHSHIEGERCSREHLSPQHSLRDKHFRYF